MQTHKLQNQFRLRFHAQPVTEGITHPPDE